MATQNSGIGVGESTAKGEVQTVMVNDSSGHDGTDIGSCTSLMLKRQKKLGEVEFMKKIILCKFEAEKYRIYGVPQTLPSPRLQSW